MDYEKQGRDFLTKTGVKMRVTYVNYGPHFAGDKESRDRYRVTLSRNGKSMRIMFGQSLAKGAVPPTAYDILSCIQKYDVGSFENFCGDFGYDEDSRTAERVYKAVRKEYAGVQRIFSEEEIDEMQEIQ
jgi:hypothetical protein